MGMGGDARSTGKEAEPTRRVQNKKGRRSVPSSIPNSGNPQILAERAIAARFW